MFYEFVKKRVILTHVYYVNIDVFICIYRYRISEIRHSIVIIVRVGSAKVDAATRRFHSTG